MNSSTGEVLNRDTIGAFGFYPAAVVNVSILLSALNAEAKRETYAIDCSIYFCAVRYNASFAQGLFQENVDWEYDPTNENTASFDSDLTFTAPATFVPTQEATTFTVNGLRIRALRTYLTALLAGDVKGDAQKMTYSSDAIEALYSSVAVHQRSSYNGLLSSIYSLATGPSIDIRTNPGGPADVVVGTAWQDATYVRVRWGWLILPLILEVIGAFSLVSTIFLSIRSGTPVWKSSLLGPLFLGLPSGAPTDAGRESSASTVYDELSHGAYSLEQMENKAKQIRIGVRKDEAGRYSLSKHANIEIPTMDEQLQQILEPGLHLMVFLGRALVMKSLTRFRDGRDDATAASSMSK